MAHPSSGLSVAHDKAERPSPHGGSEGICALLSARWSEHRACYETTWQREDIHHMIDTLQELRSCLLSVPTNPQNSFSDLRSLQNGVDGSLTLQQCEYELARAHNDCYAQTGDIDELNKGMAILSALLSHLDASTDDTVIFQRLLGSLYRNRFGATKDKEDVRAALDLLSSTLSKCPSEHPERACTLFELGLAEHANNLSQHCAEDVNRSISYLDEALSLGDAKHAWQPICRDGLATALQYRYFMSEQLCDLEAAIKHLRQTLTELPLHHRDRWMAENHLGLALVLVYRHSGQESKLIDSLVYLRSAVACASKMNHAVAQPRCVTNLSAALFLRWQHQADVEALHEAIQLLRNTRPLSGVANWAHAINFASFLVERFDVLGEEDDLDEGIIILRQCISLAILRGEDRLSYHTEQLNLVQALRLRYELHGSQDDLSSARALCHEMVVHPTLNSMSRLHSIGSMAELLSYAYMRTKQNALLSDAEEFGRQWVDANGLNLDHFHYDIGLSDVAQVFMQCYKARRLMADLDQSIELWEKSVELRSQAGRPGLRESLIGLANGLLERYSTLKAVEDAARAKALLLEALRFAKSTGGDVVLPHLEVARMHLTRNSPNFDLSAALHHFAQALDNVHHHFSQCLRNAVELLKRFEDELFLHPYESAQHTEALLINYSRTIELLPRVAYLGLDESIRLNALSGDVNQLSSTAAVRAGCLGKLETAVELLEQGRAVFWVHRLQLRVPVKDLPPNLAERITVVATRLEQQQPIRLQMERSIEATQRLAESHFIKQRQLSREFEQLVDQVRQQPSFERFLLPAPFSVLSMAAVKNPVLILVTGNERAIGILLTCPHLTPQRLDFPGLALSKVRELSLQLVGASKRRRMSVRERAFKISQRNRSYDMEDILGVLWNSVAKVVIRALRLEKRLASYRPRLLICATGPFSQLPIHAANVYNLQRCQEESLSDYCVVSYTPTISGLLKAQSQRSAVPTKAAQILLVAASSPVAGWHHLACAEDEIKHIFNILPQHMFVDVLCDTDRLGSQHTGQPTVNEVLKRLPGTAILHLACHGYQNNNSPLESGFILNDGVLTLEQLLSVKLEDAFLAFLSACETAKGDEARLDQTIHLAAAMLFAGFSSVIGTLWAMDDVDGPEVAAMVYQELLKDGSDTLNGDAVPYALDRAVQKLRAKGLSPSRWAPYVHMGA